MTRILYFTRAYSSHDYRFVSSLVEAGYEVHYLRLVPVGQDTEDRPLPHQVNSISWSGGPEQLSGLELLRTIAQLKSILSTVKPDIVHAGPVPTCTYLMAKAGARVLVAMSWGSDLLRDVVEQPALKIRAQFALNHTTVLVGDCQAVQDKAQQLGFDPAHTVLFPWGIDLEVFAPGSSASLRKRMGWQNAFVLLSLRSWEPVYGVDVIVTGFARAVELLSAEQNEQPLRLILLGSGSQAARIHSILSAAEVQDYVLLGGQVPQAHLPEYYHAADLYLSASHSDGSSVSLMEALACGVPSLVSDIPGNQEWITPGKQGWLFVDDDAEALAQGIVSAYRQRKQLNPIRLNARKIAEARANWPDNFAKLLEAYQLAIKLTQNE